MYFHEIPHNHILFGLCYTYGLTGGINCDAIKSGCAVKAITIAS